MEGGGLYSSRNKSLGASKRMKISRACDECRKRKVKCDGVQPCGRCRKSNAECVFAKLPPKRGPPKQYMENLENRLQRVEKALKSMTAPVRRVFEETLASEKKKQSLELSNNNIPKIPEVSYSNKKSTVSYSAPYTSEISHIDRFTINEIGQAVYVNDLKVRVDRIPNENQHHHLYLSNNNDTQSDISDSPISSSTASFFNPQTPPTIVTTQHLTELPFPDHLSSRLLVSEVQPLTEIYFDHVHKYVPMIHKPIFLKQMHSPTNPPSRLLLYAMSAVASRWTKDQLHLQQPQPFSSGINKTTVVPAGYTYYQRALEILDDFVDVPRISTVQALILIVKYQEYFQRNGYFHRSYFYLGMAVRMCQDLGLSQLDGGDMDSETKRRTFWVAFVYDLLSSVEQGHSTFFDVQKCKTGFPLVTGEEGPALEELITNQNIFIQLGKVLSEIYVMSRRIAVRHQTQGNLRSEEQTVEEQARLFSLHTHLENFLYEVPPSLIYPPTQDTESYPAEKQLIGDPFIGFLHMTYHFSVILLHRIYLSLPPPKTEHDFVSYSHRRLCAASASNITMIVETIYERYPTYIFHYPMRGVQHTIHCLATAATIHKYEMLNGEDESIREVANRQYIISLNIMQQLSNQSPAIELLNHFGQPPQPPSSMSIAEKRMSAPPIQNPMMIYNNNDTTTVAEQERSPRVRRNTFSSTAMDENALYQSSVSIGTDPMHHHFITPSSGYVTRGQFMPMQQWQVSPEEMQLNQQQQYNRRSYHQSMTPQWNQPMYYNNPPPYPTSDPFDTTTLMSSPPSSNNGRIRRHTVSNPSQQHSYYPAESSSSSYMMMQQQQENDMKKQTHHFDPNLSIDMMVDSTGGTNQQDTMMIDTSQQQHYDPTSGMSQLFLTDDQPSQQQQQQQISWDGSMISDSNIQRSEGHVMK